MSGTPDRPPTGSRRLLGPLAPVIALVLTTVVVGTSVNSGGSATAAGSPSVADAAVPSPGEAVAPSPGGAVVPSPGGAVAPGTLTPKPRVMHPRASVTTPLPGGRPRYVVSIMGGSFNKYWVRLAQYSFTPGRGGTGTVRQSYWMWYQSSFSGNARTNKVTTGYVTRGCAAACAVRTPRGYQPGTGPMASLTGTYRFDRNGRLVIQWPGRRIEAWTVSSAGRKAARLTLHHTTLGGIHGDGLGSTASFSAGVSRDQVASSDLTGVQRVASYGAGGRFPVRTSYWSTNVVAPMQRCAGTRSACLLHTGRAWRSAIVVPTGLGRRAFWQHQKQGSDGDVGKCFGSGGGHTIALLQALDDDRHFVGFVGAEASLNGRSWRNAVIGQLILT